MAARILPLICLLLNVLSSSVHNRVALITLVDAASFNTSSSAPANTSSCFAADLVALRSFAANYNASDRITEHWKGHDCCSWEGVTCTTSTNSSEPAAAGRVSGLDLTDGYFTGPEALLSLCNLSALRLLQLQVFSLSTFPTVSIPECIGTDLTNLESLVLSDSVFTLTGSIFPQSFSRLRSLRVLDLSGNGLSGPLPSFLFTGLPNLITLDLRWNSFSGSILAFDAPHLHSLNLSQNAFSGNISDFVSHSNLPSLSYLLFHGNSLSGDIPPFDPSRFSSLQGLWLSNNRFTGSLPKSLCELATLQVLDVASNGLTGEIPSQWQTQFANLSLLNLADNRFTGPVPSWIGSLSNLASLSLGQNQFASPLPSWIGSLSSLQYLDLFYGNFRGPFPSSAGSLSKLQDLDLSYNNFTGPFPSLVGSLSSLQFLDLSYNNFTGRLPDEWHKLSHLSFLGLSGNSLMPHDHPNSPMLLPPSLFQLPQLTSLSLASMRLQPADLDCGSRLLLLNATIDWLDLSDNNLNASVFRCLSDNNFTSLSQYLNMAGNPLALTLNGADPVKLLLMHTPIANLDLSSCELNGSLTHMFTEGTMSTIRELYLANNRLVGKIPTHLGNLSGLDTLDLSHNSLTGGLPASLGKCVSLERLKLNDNFLEGIIPDEVFKNVRTLSLSNNHLTGPILSSIRNNKELVFLDLSHNSFVGDLQTLFTDLSDRNFTKLRVLLLGYNNFTGSIPLSLGNCTPALQVIDISHNSLVGHIPNTLQDLRAFQDTTIGSLSVVQGTLYEEFIIHAKGGDLQYTYALEVLTSLDLSGNQLSGPIPTSFRALSGLVYLNLSRNNLFGPIPSDLGKLSMLESLDLSYNKLSGSIPTSFYNLTKLEVFNVSYNEGLSGSIPHNQPQFEYQESYIGDRDLCGEPTLHACAGPTLADQPGDNKFEEKSSFSRWIDEWVSIPALCFGHLVGFLGTLALIKMWWRH